MLRISHDDGGSGTGWFIDSITVQDLKTYQKFNFPCKQWLAQDQGDKLLERELIIEGKYIGNCMWCCRSIATLELYITNQCIMGNLAYQLFYITLQCVGLVRRNKQNSDYTIHHALKTVFLERFTSQTHSVNHSLKVGMVSNHSNNNYTQLCTTNRTRNELTVHNSLSFLCVFKLNELTTSPLIGGKRAGGKSDGGQRQGQKNC